MIKHIKTCNYKFVLLIRAHVAFSLEEENIFRSFTLSQAKINATLKSIKSAKVPGVDGAVMAIYRHLRNIKSKVVMASGLLGIDRTSGESLKFERATEEDFTAAILEEFDSFISSNYGGDNQRFEFSKLAGTEFQGLLSSRQAVDSRNDTAASDNDNEDDSGNGNGSGNGSQSSTETSASNQSNSTVVESDRKKRGNAHTVR